MVPHLALFQGLALLSSYQGPAPLAVLLLISIPTKHHSHTAWIQAQCSSRLGNPCRTSPSIWRKQRGNTQHKMVVCTPSAPYINPLHSINPLQQWFPNCEQWVPKETSLSNHGTFEKVPSLYRVIAIMGSLPFHLDVVALSTMCYTKRYQNCFS